MQNDNQQFQIKTSPSITLSNVQDCISTVHYFTASQGVIGSGQQMQFGSPLLTLSFCVLVLKNGFTVTGESACVSPDNYNVKTGQDIARANAENKIWPLLAYQLKTKIADTII